VDHVRDPIGFLAVPARPGDKIFSGAVAGRQGADVSEVVGVEVDTSWK
jgi:hypothetical protein